MHKQILGALLSITMAASWPTTSAAAIGAGMEEETLFAEIPTVVTASLRKQALDKVPGTMTVITEAQIRLLGAQNVRQILDIVPGFNSNVETYNYQNEVVRGYKFGGGHLKMLIDGHPVNSTNHKGTEAWTDMPLDHVKQIEVIRGPGSSLYGTDAFMGVVNIITKKDEGGHLSATGGSLGRWGGSAAMNSDPDARVRYRFNYNQFGEQGNAYRYEKTFFSTPWVTSAYSNQTNAFRDKNKYHRRFETGAELGVGELSLTVRHAENVRQWSEGYVNVATPADSFVAMRASYADATYVFHMGQESRLTLNASYDQDLQRYEGQVAPPFFSYTNSAAASAVNGIPAGTYTFGAQGSVFNSYIHGQRYNGKALFETSLWTRHAVTLGAEYGYQYIPEAASIRNNYAKLPWVPTTYQKYEGQDPNNWSLAEHSSEEHYGLFGQDIIDMAPLTAILGIRYDQYSKAGDALSPRVALIYEAPWRQIFKASFGQAFYAPYTSQRYTQSFGYRSDPKLEPQSIKTYELSIQNTFSSRFHYVLTGFTSKRVNGFGFDSSRSGQGLPVYYNADETHYYGSEIESRWEAVVNRLNLWGNFSWVKGREKGLYTSGAETVTTYPRKLANAGATMFATANLSVSAYGHFVSEAHRYKPGQGGEIAGYGYLNGAVTYQTGKGMTVQLSGQNLLGKRALYYNDQGFFAQSSGIRTYEVGNDFEGYGRQIYLKTTYEWGGKE